MRNSTSLLATIGAVALLTTATVAQTPSGRPLTASLVGSAEVPGPGDPDGTGGFALRVNPGLSRLCYNLTVSGIAAPTGAHIHAGAAGVAGPVRIALATPSNGISRDCIALSRELAMAILTSPGSFYVNVHNAAYPGGAIRGQLHR